MSSDSVTKIKGSLKPVEIGIGFGSNLGDRLANLSKARKHLLEICVFPDKALFSPVYETPPVGCTPHSRPFYNAVGHLAFNSPPESVLEYCLRIECSLGRQNDHEKNSPRTIDLDILYAGDRIYSDPHLTIPHPRLRMRLFVIAPLASILPELCLPGDDLTINDHFRKLSLEHSELPEVTQHW